MLSNASTKKSLARRVKLASSAWQRFKGLMFEKRNDFALVFPLPAPTRLGASIHTFFMHHAIDVVYLDSRKRVQEFHFKAKPWLLNLSPLHPASFLIELPAGSLKGKVKKGDELKW